MRYCFFCLLTVLLGGAGRLASAQAPGPTPRAGALVQGTVLDSAAGQPLREASVALLLARDSSYVTFSLTDGAGHYALRGARPGRYLVLVTALGYRARQQPVEITAAQPAITLPPLRVRAEAQQLGEVVVTHQQAPVSISGDTVAFSARAFRTQPNATVESLLKKLPGVEVDRDGTIRVQGQTVPKVLVDGKPFFGSDPKLATRNLPANIIDKVQLYEQQNDQAAFSGIESGERQHTINLITKRDKRRGYFGTNGAGAGTDGRYQAQLGLNRFDNGRQVSGLAQADNVNRLGFSNDTNPASGAASSPDASSVTSSGGGTVLATPGGARAALGSSAAGSPTGITESASGGLNYRDAWGKRLEIAGSYLATRATTHNDQQSRRQNLTGTTAAADVPLTDRLAASRARTTGQRADLRLDYQLDSLTTLRVVPSLAWQATDQLRTATQQTTQASQLLNQSTSAYAAQARSFSGGGNALLLRKFRRVGRTFSVGLASNWARQAGGALNQSRNVFYSVGGGVGAPQVIDQRFDQQTPTQRHALNFSYVEPFGLRHQLELHYTLTNAPSRAARLTTDYDAATDQYDAYNALLSNDFTSRFTTHRAGLTWQTRRLHYTYNLGLDAQQAALQLDNQTADAHLRRRYPTLLPAANFTYAGAAGRHLRLNYRTALNPPSATQLQPVPDNSNPLSLRLGNPDLQPEYAHTLTATYNQFRGTRGVSGVLMGSRVQHRVVSATTFDAAGVRTTQPVNANGYYALNGYLALSQRLPAHQLNLNANTAGALTRSQSFINGQANEAHTLSLGQTLSANSAYNERLELNFSANCTYQRASYSLAAAQNAAYFTQTLTADLYYRLPGRWVLSADAYFTNNTGLAAGYNQRVLLANAGLAYQLFASRQGEIKLYAYDLLNQNQSVVRTATDTYLEDVRSRVRTRYALLSFTYQLRSFGK